MRLLSTFLVVAASMASVVQGAYHPFATAAGSCSPCSLTIPNCAATTLNIPDGAAVGCSTLSSSLSLLPAHTKNAQCTTTVNQFFCDTLTASTSCYAPLPADFSSKCSAAVACLDSLGQLLATSNNLCTQIASQFGPASSGVTPVAPGGGAVASSTASSTTVLSSSSTGTVISTVTNTTVTTVNSTVVEAPQQYVTIPSFTIVTPSFNLSYDQIASLLNTNVGDNTTVEQQMVSVFSQIQKQYSGNSTMMMNNNGTMLNTSASSLDALVTLLAFNNSLKLSAANYINVDSYARELASLLNDLEGATGLTTSAILTPSIAAPFLGTLVGLLQSYTGSMNASDIAGYVPGSIATVSVTNGNSGSNTTIINGNGAVNPTGQGGSNSQGGNGGSAASVNDPTNAAAGLSGSAAVVLGSVAAVLFTLF